MSARRRIPIPFLVLVAVGAASWFFARDIVKALEGLGLIPKRGLVFNDISDVMFSLVVVSLVYGVYVLVLGVRELLRESRPVVTAAEDDPRYAELLRQKDILLRELKELEFDREMRKIEGEDYAIVEQRLRGQALGILKAVDELDPVRLYEARIRADLARYAEGGSAAAALDGADDAWRTEVLARPLYRDLAKVLGERDLLLAALRNYWIEAAEVDRGAPEKSKLSVRQGDGAPAPMTLGELRRKVVAALKHGDDAEALRLARLVGMPASATPAGEVRVDRGAGPVACSAAELRSEALARLSQNLGAGVAA